MAMKKKIGVFLLCLVLCGCASAGSRKACFTDGCIDVEVADNDRTRARGLMFKDRIQDAQGMLFVFPQDGVFSFWMKNMRFSLDILWIDAAWRIVDFHADIPPCTSMPCQSYSPSGPVRYVLEVNAGFIQRHDIRKGQSIKFK